MPVIMKRTLNFISVEPPYHDNQYDSMTFLHEKTKRSGRRITKATTNEGSTTIYKYTVHLRIEMQDGKPDTYIPR